MKKRTVSLFLALALCLGLSGGAFAAREDFIIENGVLTEYNGHGGDVRIPDGVAEIGDGAFIEADLTAVTIPGSTIVIGPSAFFGCKNLASVTMEQGVAFIKENAFRFCTSLTSIIIPDGVITIEDFSFFGCDSLTSVVIPNTVSSISQNAFTTHIDSPEYLPIPGLTVYGTPGSYAETYAKEAGLTFRDSSLLSPAATPTASTVLVNGANTAFDAYNIGGANYFKLRDIAFVLNGTGKQFEVSWDGAANAISLISGQHYTAVGGEMTAGTGAAQTATPTSSRILLNGAEVSLEAYNIGGNNYFKLRDLGSAFDFGVDWDAASNTIILDTAKGYAA